MSEDAQAQNTGPQREFVLQRIYTKDLSFEAPHSPKIFTEEWRPEIGLNLNTSVNEIGEHQYELVLTLTVTAKSGETTAFLAEVQQAGIFMIRGVPDNEMGPMLGIYCPNILFPYAREVVSDLVTRGSFPQLLLSPVNFEALYAQHMQQRQAAAESADQAQETQ